MDFAEHNDPTKVNVAIAESPVKSNIIVVETTKVVEKPTTTAVLTVLTPVAPSPPGPSSIPSSPVNAPRTPDISKTGDITLIDNSLTITVELPPSPSAVGPSSGSDTLQQPTTSPSHDRNDSDSMPRQPTPDPSHDDNCADDEGDNRMPRTDDSNNAGTEPSPILTNGEYFSEPCGSAELSPTMALTLEADTDTDSPRIPLKAVIQQEPAEQAPQRQPQKPPHRPDVEPLPAKSPGLENIVIEASDVYAMDSPPNDNITGDRNGIVVEHAPTRVHAPTPAPAPALATAPTRTLEPIADVPTEQVAESMDPELPPPPEGNTLTSNYSFVGLNPVGRQLVRSDTLATVDSIDDMPIDVMSINKYHQTHYNPRVAFGGLSNNIPPSSSAIRSEGGAPGLSLTTSQFWRSEPGSGEADEGYTTPTPMLLDSVLTESCLEDEETPKRSVISTRNNVTSKNLNNVSTMSFFSVASEFDDTQIIKDDVLLNSLDEVQPNYVCKKIKNSAEYRDNDVDSDNEDPAVPDLNTLGPRRRGPASDAKDRRVEFCTLLC
jgi:hypothetical protein